MCDHRGVTDGAAPPRSPLRRAPLVAAAVATVMVALLAVALAGLLIVRHFVDSIGTATPPYHPSNPSWKYGLRLMTYPNYGAYDKADPTTDPDDVVAVCRSAIQRSHHPSVGFDLDEAVSGCRYGEWELDD